MEVPAKHVRAFRKTFDISVGAPSVEGAEESFHEMVGDVYGSLGLDADNGRRSPRKLSAPSSPGCSGGAMR